MKSSSRHIRFYFQAKASLLERPRLKATLAEIFQTYGKEISSLNIIFCSDEYLLGINRQYLNHDYYTDIITFNYANPGEPIIGEIYISIDRVKENASGLSVSFEHELHRVIFHGVLHLVGFDDQTASAQKQMSSQEDRLLASYVPRNTVSLRNNSKK